MGACFSGASGESAPAPSTTKTRDSVEMRTILKEAFSLPSAKIFLSDGLYCCYSRTDLKKFLAANGVDKRKYHKQRYDCDDFSYSLIGAERAWFSKHNKEEGSSFGIVWGDLRRRPGDTERRPHAMNFLVDHNGKVWLVEPQTDDIYQLTPESTVWMAVD